ncbi:MAG: 50S ribosomal protein L25, partial [Bacteroidota bacterium]
NIFEPKGYFSKIFVMEIVKITGAARTDLGTTHSRNLRKEGKVPCVIYGGDQPIHFSATGGQFRSIIYTPAFKQVEISLNGKTYNCILKDTQFHPVTDQLMHVDLLELVPGKTVKLELPVQFTGASPGVKTGGKLIRNLRRVKVKTTPEKMVDHVTLDISSLELGQSVRVRDIAKLDGVEVINNSAIPVATVEIPRALKSAATAAAKEEAAATQE